MNMLRSFLGWSYKNANDRRRLDLRQRALNIHMRDTELERGLCMLKEYVRYGDFWYNCLKSPEPFWYIGKRD